MDAPYRTWTATRERGVCWDVVIVVKTRVRKLAAEKEPDASRQPQVRLVREHGWQRSPFSF